MCSGGRGLKAVLTPLCDLVRSNYGKRVYRKEMELPIEDMKQFLDGILHIYDEGRTAVKMGDLFGIVTEAEERVAEKENFRGSLTSEKDD